MRALLVRGMLAGLIAGVLATVFAYVFGEPSVRAAVGLEESGGTITVRPKRGTRTAARPRERP